MKYEVSSQRLITWLRLDIHLQTDLGFKPNGSDSSIQHAFPSHQCDYRQPLEGCRTSANPFYMGLAHLPPVGITEMAGMGVSWSCGGAEGETPGVRAPIMHTFGVQSITRYITLDKYHCK